MNERQHLRLLVDEAQRERLGIVTQDGAMPARRCGYRYCDRMFVPSKHRPDQRFCSSTHRVSEWRAERGWPQTRAA